MSNQQQQQQRVRRNASPATTKQGPMKATLPVAALMRPSGGGGIPSAAGSGSPPRGSGVGPGSSGSGGTPVARKMSPSSSSSDSPTIYTRFSEGQKVTCSNRQSPDQRISPEWKASGSPNLLKEKSKTLTSKFSSASSGFCSVTSGGGGVGGGVSGGIPPSSLSISTGLSSCCAGGGISPGGISSSSLSASIIRRTSSLDTLYLASSPWPAAASNTSKDSFYGSYCGRLMVDRATQTPEEWDEMDKKKGQQKKIVEGLEMKYIRQRLQRSNQISRIAGTTSTAAINNNTSSVAPPQPQLQQPPGYSSRFSPIQGSHPPPPLPQPQTAQSQPSSNTTISTTATGNASTAYYLPLSSLTCSHGHVTTPAVTPPVSFDPVVISPSTNTTTSNSGNNSNNQQQYQYHYPPPSNQSSQQHHSSALLSHPPLPPPAGGAFYYSPTTAYSSNSSAITGVTIPAATTTPPLSSSSSHVTTSSSGSYCSSGSGYSSSTLAANPIPIPHIPKPLIPRMRSSVEGLNQEIEKLVLRGISGNDGLEGDTDRMRAPTPDGHRAPIAKLFRTSTLSGASSVSASSGGGGSTTSTSAVNADTQTPSSSSLNAASNKSSSSSLRSDKHHHHHHKYHQIVSGGGAGGMNNGGIGGETPSSTTLASPSGGGGSGGSSDAASSRSHSVSPIVPLIPGPMESSRPTSRDVGRKSGSPEELYPCEDKLGASPQINKFLAREPPDGCEKVKLFEEPSKQSSPLIVEPVKSSGTCTNYNSYPLNSSSNNTSGGGVGGFSGLTLRPSVNFVLMPSQSSAFHPLYKNYLPPSATSGASIAISGSSSMAPSNHNSNGTSAASTVGMNRMTSSSSSTPPPSLVGGGGSNSSPSLNDRYKEK